MRSGPAWVHGEIPAREARLSVAFEAPDPTVDEGGDVRNRCNVKPAAALVTALLISSAVPHESRAPARRVLSMRWIIVFLAVALVFATSCTRLRLAPRYLSRCPAEGPVRSNDLGLLPAPIELEDFYASVRERAGTFDVAELGSVHDGKTAYPILAVHRPRSAATRRMLVVAGIHGNETAGLLAVPAILDLLESDAPEFRAWDVTVIAPANPVGVAHGSRYNGDGCDLNRDFREPRTHEARLIRDFITRQPPDLIVSLHEGPQDGYLLVVTSKGSRQLGETAVRAVGEHGIALARKHFAGLSLGAPGLSAEGLGTEFLKWVLRLHTLGSFATRLGIGAYTTETPWSSENFEDRTLAHVVTVKSLLIAGSRNGLAPDDAARPDAP